MSVFNDANDSSDVTEQFIHSPTSTARDVVEKEKSEIIAEKKAFESFHVEISDIDEVRSGRQDMRVGDFRNNSISQISQVSSIYEEKVLGLPHYDDVYGEALLENIAAELGSEVAEALHPSTTIRLNPIVKEGIKSAAEHAIKERMTYKEILCQEVQSIDNACDGLTNIINRQNHSGNIGGEQSPALERIQNIALERQRLLQNRVEIEKLDGHTLCEYLYSDESWRYPVLTSVTRVRKWIGQ